MNCTETIVKEVCYTVAGARQTLLAHYTYGPSTGAVPSQLLRTVFTDANGVPVDTTPGTVTVGSCALQAATLETETFIAIAGQTTFTLTQVPVSDVDFTRNGASLADAAATTVVNSKVVTYVPAANGGNVLLAGDRIDITYLYYV